MIPDTLPLAEDDLRALVAALDLPTGDDDPFRTDGAWSFDPYAGWPRRWYLEARLADWRELADPRYEGLEDADLAARALAEGRLPGHLVDDPAAVTELFKDNSGNVYLQLEGVRTVDGHEPVFFFDHDERWTIRARARNLVELYAREALTLAHPSDRELRKRLEAPIALDPASVAQFGDVLADGWREAVGLPARGEPMPPRRGPDREVVRGEALGGMDQLAAYKEAFVARYILARAVDGDALADVLRPMTWWQVGTFRDLDADLRDLMARVLTLASRRPPPDADRAATWRREREVRDLLAAAEFLDGLLQRGQVVIDASQNAADLVREACNIALERITGDRYPDGVPAKDDGKRLLDEVPEMSAFHGGWAGIVPDEVLARGDHVAFATVLERCRDLALMQNTAYNLVRTCGDDHVDALRARLPDLLPYDQVLVLHGLDNFPKHPGVLALYDEVLATTSHATVRGAVTRYRARVASGVKPSGWES